MPDWAGLNGDWLAAFGDVVTVDPAGSAATITGAFRAPWSGATEEGIQYERPDPELHVRTADWNAGGWSGGTVIALPDGTQYTVVDEQPDYDDMTVLTLRRY